MKLVMHWGQASIRVKENTSQTPTTTSSPSKGIKKTAKLCLALVNPVTY